MAKALDETRLNQGIRKAKEARVVESTTRGLNIEQ